MDYSQDWSFWIRSLTLVVSVCGLLVAWNRIRLYRNFWTWKTVDLKLALVLWLITAVAASIQNIADQAEGGPKTILALLAAAVSTRALHRRGDWGGRDD